MPETSARERVQKFEQDLAKKSPQFDKEAAWIRFEKLASDSVESAKISADLEAKQGEAAAKKDKAEEARWVGAEARWAKWVSSKSASGHLLHQLKAMRELGPAGMSRVIGSPLKEKAGYGRRLTLVTPDGIRIDAAYYGNRPTSSSEKLSGFELTKSDKSKFKRSSLASDLGLPESEFKAVTLKYDPNGVNLRWTKISAPLGYDSDVNLNKDDKSMLVFWQGP